MKIAYVIFDGITWMDLIGVYEPVSKLKTMKFVPELSWDFCSFTPAASDYGGLSVLPTQVKNDLSGYDVLFVPGGKGTRELMTHEPFLEWIQTAADVKLKTSVCTGSLLLGAAGFLKNKKATTHFDEYDTLKPLCGEVLTDRIVADGDCITAGAVTSSIDLGLRLCREWAGEEAAVMIRYKMDYRG
jgi:putative intracellular protease/amidase